MTTDFNNFYSVLQAIRAQYPVNKRFQIACNDFITTVHVNSDTLYQILTQYFSEFLVHTPYNMSDVTITVHDAPAISLPYAFRMQLPSAPHKKIKHEWIDIDGGRVLRNRITHMTYIIGSTEHCIAGPCLETKNQVVNFINSRFINHKVNSGYLLGHGSGVATHGRGMIISGNSGAGKSTLALHMLSSGATFVSNDRVLISKNRLENFYGTMQHPRINPGTALNNPNLEHIIESTERARLRRLTAEALWQVESKYDALIPHCFGQNRFVPQAPLSAIAVLDWRRDASPMDISCMNAAESAPYLAHMMKKNDLMHIPLHKGYTEPSIREYIAALDNTPVFVIRGGVDFANATNTLLTFLKTGRTDS